MGVNSKHIATFLLGAAAGAALIKYNSLTQEEKDELVAKMKDNASKLKDEAEQATETVKDYMDELKDKGLASLKDLFGDADKTINDIFNTNRNSDTKTS